MRPQSKALLVVLLSVSVVVAAVGTYLFAARVPLNQLPIAAGTVIGNAGYTLSFTVVFPGRLVGAWYANHGGMIWIYPTGSPPGVYFLPCIGSFPWNGTANVSLAPGAYTASFSPLGRGTIVVTQAVRLGYPSNSPGTRQTLLASWCGLA